MTEPERNFAALLDGLSEMQVREMGIEAIRRVRRTGDRASTIILDPTTFQRELVALLVTHRGTPDARPNVAPLLMTLTAEWATPILLFFVWMERAGLIFRFGGSTGEPIQRFKLLPAGLRFFDSAGNEHPHIPGWLERLRARCPNLNDETFNLLQDSHECFEHELHRASVALLGVAFESVVQDALDSMIARGIAQAPNANNAVRRLAVVRAGIPACIPGNEGRVAATHACDFAEHLRRRRNDASHRIASFPFNDRQEVEDLLVSGARHLPGLYALL